MSTEVRVPALGESVTEATVATWFKQPGEQVSVDEMLCELETDKVTVEVPSPAAGKLAEIVAAEGATVAPDALLATLSAADGAAPAPAGTDAAPAATTAAPASEGKGNGQAVDVVVPALGESVTEATVSTWFKAAGDSVAADEMLCELETDKVSVEVPAPVAGILAEVLKGEGETVEAGGKLAVMAAGEGAATAAPAAKPAAAEAGPATEQKGEDAPSARKMMAEADLSSDQVSGTGRDGRVMKEDVLKAISAPAEPDVPAQAARAPVAVEDAAREERVKMTRLRQTIARRLKDAQNTAAVLTTYNEVDMSAVMALRQEYKDLFERKHGVKLGFMSFFTKACCHALAEVPEVNAEIDGTDIVYKSFVHMGIAVGTPSGLVVPVVRDARPDELCRHREADQRARRAGS